MNFRNVEQILTFAYSISAASIVKTTTFGDTSPTTGEIMSPQDMHAQSVFIIKTVERELAERELYFVACRFSADPDIIRFAMRGLAYLYVASGTKVDSKLAHDLVGRHFSPFRRQRETMRELAYNHGMSLRTLERREQAVTGYLNEVWEKAEALSEAAFIETGLMSMN